MALPSWPFSINSNSPQANGLVSWWPWLASRSAVWRDLKGRVNLAPTGSPDQGPAGEMGWCTSLVGTSSQRWAGTSTQLDAVIAGNVQWTATVWVRQASAVTNKWLLSKYNTGTFKGFDFRIDPTVIYFQITDIGGTLRQFSKTWTLATGTWTLVSCGMRANQQAFIKVNSVASSVADLSSYTFATDTNAFTVGGATNFFTGDIADVRIYNLGLSDAELNAIYSPATRWDLYRQPRRYYYAPQAAAVDELIANGVTTESPVCGTPALSQIHAISGISVSTGAPALGTPAITQMHALTGTGIATGAPTLGTPVAAETHALTGTGIASGAPALGTPAIIQVHALTATGIATGAPALGTPAITQLHALTATGIATGAPTLGTPVAAETHALTATGIATGAPTLGTPTITQVHLLAAPALDTTSPSLGLPAISQLHVLVAMIIATGAATVGSPYLVQGLMVAPSSRTFSVPSETRSNNVAASSRTRTA